MINALLFAITGGENICTETRHVFFPSVWIVKELVAGVTVETNKYCEYANGFLYFAIFSAFKQ